MTDTPSPAAVASFRAGGATGEVLAMPRWSDDDWARLFAYTSARSIQAGDALIRHGEPDRTLYFVLSGRLEVIAKSADGLSMGALNEAGAGTVLGELSFFDGSPRSAGAWAVGPCEVAALTPERYAEFEQGHPALARDLLFALGGVVSARLRKTSARVAA